MVSPISRFAPLPEHKLTSLKTKPDLYSVDDSIGSTLDLLNALFRDSRLEVEIPENEKTDLLSKLDEAIDYINNRTTEISVTRLNNIASVAHKLLTLRRVENQDIKNKLIEITQIKDRGIDPLIGDYFYLVGINNGSVRFFDLEDPQIKQEFKNRVTNIIEHIQHSSPSTSTIHIKDLLKTVLLKIQDGDLRRDLLGATIKLSLGKAKSVK